MTPSEGDSGGRFAVGVDSGLVTVARPLDRERQERYALTLAVTDGRTTRHAKVGLI